MCVHMCYGCAYAELVVLCAPHPLQGQEVFKFAVRSVPSIIDAALSNAGMTKENVDWLVMHQVRR